MRLIWPVAIMVGALIGGAFGWFAAPPAAPLAQPRASVPPGIATARYKPDADLAWLTRRDPWGARAAPVAAPTPAPSPQAAAGRPWRIGGVMVWGGDMMAIILGPAGVAPEYRRIGESLPDGSRIVDMASGAVTVEQGGVRRVLRLTTPK